MPKTTKPAPETKASHEVALAYEAYNGASVAYNLALEANLAFNEHDPSTVDQVRIAMDAARAAELCAKDARKAWNVANINGRVDADRAAARSRAARSCARGARSLANGVMEAAAKKGLL